MSLTRRTSLPHRGWLVAVLPAALSIGGCGAQAGGQTGEESGEGCVFATQALSRSERSALGFSAAEVLAFAEGARSANFDWRQTPGINYGPESGAGAIALQISAAGTVRFASIDTARSQSHCEDHLRIPVRVALVTDGGALDESLAVDLVAATADEAAVTRAVPRAELSGALAFDPGTLGERRFSRLEVNLRIRADGTAGYLFAGIEGGGQTDGTASFQALPLACWGAIPSLSSACAD